MAVNRLVETGRLALGGEGEEQIDKPVQGVLTDLEEQAGEGRASWSAGDPEDDGILRRVPLRLDEVVEEARAVLLVHLHVPAPKT